MRVSSAHCIVCSPTKSSCPILWTTTDNAQKFLQREEMSTEDSQMSYFGGHKKPSLCNMYSRHSLTCLNDNQCLLFDGLWRTFLLKKYAAEFSETCKFSLTKLLPSLISSFLVKYFCSHSKNNSDPLVITTVLSLSKSHNSAASASIIAAAS